MFQHKAAAGLFASRRWLLNHELIAHPLNQLLEPTFACMFVSTDGQSESEYFRHCRALDLSFNQHYLALPEEMAARAFEHMLQQQPLKNAFLVAGTQQSQLAKLGAYPSPALSAALGSLWLHYFQQLGRALQASV